MPSTRSGAKRASPTATLPTPKTPPKKAKPAPKKEKPVGKPASKKAKAVITKAADDDGVPKLRSIVVKGKAAVDEASGMTEKAHVYEDQSQGVVWDCMLNQTNIQNNNNKFYLIQLLESDSTQEYWVWMRWGRVGYKGQTSLTPTGSNLVQAQKVFESKFQSKTHNDWQDKDNFEKVVGKYDLVQMDYSAGNEDEMVLPPNKDVKAKAIPESKLEQKVQDLINLICNIKTMEQTVMEMKYDTKKAPLGKITSDQLKAGYSALKVIAELINEGVTSGAKLCQACNDFYTRIPHEFGMKVPPLIKTNQEVKSKIELLEALGDIKIALSILDSKKDDEDLNPIDNHYHRLNCHIKHLETKSKDHEILSKYIMSTHGATHSSFSMDVLDIYDLDKSGELKKFKDHGNKLLLFHGSRLSNWAGILGQGLRIAPPEAPVTGYMFGKGVYFADMSSKSANYCWTNKSNNIGLLMLCEVSLGKPRELLNAEYNADQLPKGTHSTKGMGKTAPNPKNYVTLSDGTVVPMGPGMNTDVLNPRGYTLMYNEYIVYDVSQIRMRYLAKIKFNYKL
ncbi:hypothetical protein TCAL_10093 [Tigriopus californicus]|uniref:Poly [ADP-ribose] polymerase n=1 Tax=Tigriopus californicus TaxID=6832 RepID=A0A553P9U6_TIGCA|nr:poly [ADP-ribose] polymerase 2-like [Tigriopus californicus]TRY74450.1 hypothetical protein TCAL_10093 [Tigriopus californicus]|eukprot:TCALIF_10093-PA protein Name:"Similar to Parp2 Poly [ADP-ribose] polymerase 2 (Mus musculus)" AED:0.24 eAED:0.24 QI:0/-1/0/1/-1/1/1/0/562